MVSTFPIPTEPILKLSVAQYHAMIHAGILTDDDPVELLNGWLIEKMPKNPRHRAITKLVRTLLESQITEGYYVDSQEPITLSDSEPEPDVMIIRGATTDYLETHPQAQDVVLVVEVSDTTLLRDKTTKKEIYAGNGIENYWIINLQEQTIILYSQPDVTQHTYSNEEVYHAGESLQVRLETKLNLIFSASEVLV